MPAQAEVDAELVDLGRIPRALSDEHRRPGNGRKHGVGQRRRRTARALVRLELGIPCVADLDHALAALDIPLDRHFFDRDHFADQLGEVRDRSAQLAGVNAEDRFLLLRRDLVVEVDGGAPVARQDVAGNVRDQRNRMAGDVDAVDRALVEMPGNDGVAGAEVGILADPAWAQHATIADLEQSSFQMIGHGFPLA